MEKGLEARASKYKIQLQEDPFGGDSSKHSALNSLLFANFVLSLCIWQYRTRTSEKEISIVWLAHLHNICAILYLLIYSLDRFCLMWVDTTGGYWSFISSHRWLWVAVTDSIGHFQQHSELWHLGACSSSAKWAPLLLECWRATSSAVQEMPTHYFLSYNFIFAVVIPCCLS